jgi:hypothetical protein
MKSKANTPLSHQISSNASILLFSFMSGFAVFAVALLLQWFVYDEWLHKSGLRLVGSLLAGVLMFVSAFGWRCTVRERQIEMLRRFETIAKMNDRIRNALQVIECATYATNAQATEPVRNAVDVIEGVLQEVLAETHPALSPAPVTNAAAPKAMAKRNSA